MASSQGASGVWKARERDRRGGLPRHHLTTIGSALLVVWEQAVNGWADVIARGVTPALALSPTATSSNANGHQRYPRIAYYPARNGYLVVSAGFRDGSDDQIWGRRISGTGARVGNEIANRFLAIRQDLRAGRHDVRGQRFLVCHPTRSATVPATGSAGTAMCFSSTTDGGECADPVTLEWDFGGGTVHGTTQDARHTYTAAGTFI